MVSHFMKWCKTRFLSGYKHMSVLPAESITSKASDTEELLTKDYVSSEKLAVSESGWDETDLLSPRIREKRRELKFDEFECDVSLGGGGDCGNDRQEFSFTLYDFNGHGKITQDDIAGLVRTIYDAVGTSIKVPQGGSKTIKVKLTVSPDKREDKGNNKSQKIDKDVSVTIEENHSNENIQNNASQQNRLIENVSKEFNSLMKDKETKANNYNSASPEKNSKKFHSIHYQHQHHAICRTSLSPDVRRKECSNSPNHHRRRCREHLHRQDLFEIIKTNMEKNNLAPHKASNYHQRLPPVDSYHPKHLRELWKEDDYSYRKRYHQDLAGTEHLLPKLSESYHPCKYKLLDSNHVCSKYSKVCDHNHCRKTGHHRSRSHDLDGGPNAAVAAAAHLFKYHLLERERELPGDKYSGSCQHVRSRSHDAYDYLQSPKVQHHVRVKHSPSPHHQKHRNREHDRARAMAQVISWLERDHPSHGKSKHHDFAHKTRVSSPPGVEHHEHHHVHEHIHHHYHHYQETPVIV